MTSLVGVATGEAELTSGVVLLLAVMSNELETLNQHRRQNTSFQTGDLLIFKLIENSQTDNS